MFMVLGATLSTDYATFTTFRSLQGLFGTVPQVIGLPIIHDIYRPDGKIACPDRNGTMLTYSKNGLV